jgi:hypothetical protein
LLASEISELIDPVTRTAHGSTRRTGPCRVLTKAGTILQLSLYSDLLAATQDLAPEYMYVVAPWSEFEPRLWTARWPKMLWQNQRSGIPFCRSFWNAVQPMSKAMSST